MVSCVYASNIDFKRQLQKHKKMMKDPTHLTKTASTYIDFFLI